MSVVLVAPGAAITIPLLVHQMWVLPEYNALAFEDVVDVVVRNDSVKAEVGKLVMLYPHDVVVDPFVRTLDAEVMSYGPWSRTKYDWYFVEHPKFVDESSDARFQFRVQGFGGITNESIKADARSCQIEIHSDVQGAGAVSAMKGIRRTLLDIRFEKPLRCGEVTAFRVRLRPRQSGLSVDATPVAMATANGELPNRFCRDLWVESPDSIRLRTRVKFREELARAENGEKVRLDSLRGVFTKAIKTIPGTVARIEDHRVAVVAASDVEILPVGVTPTAALVHTVPLQLKQPDGRDMSCAATVWVSGCQQNEECKVFDVGHSATRVIDHFKFINRPADEDTLREKCGHTNRPEAFGLLLKEMISVRLLGKPSVDGLFELRQFEAPTIELAKLCARYEDAVHGRVAVLETEKPLYATFRNVHPFQVVFRVRWESFPQDYVNPGVAAMRKLELFEAEARGEWASNWHWTRIALWVGGIGTFLTAISLLYQLWIELAKLKK